MPAPINITSEQKKEFQDYIQEYYHLTIVDANDCETLSKLIYERKKVSISVTTLRRFFNIMSYIKEHSRYTLNQLARAVDFDNYQSFVERESDNCSLDDQIRLYEYDPDIYREQIKNLILRLRINNWNSTFSTQRLLQVIMRNKDWSLLGTFLDQSFGLPDGKESSYMTHIYREIIRESEVNDELNRFVEMLIPQSLNLQVHLVLTQISEYSLRGQDRRWLEQIRKPLTITINLHSLLLKLQDAYISNKEKDMRSIYDTVLDLHRKTPHVFNLESKAKLHGWCYILSDTEKLLDEEYINKLSDNDFVDYCVAYSNIIRFNEKYGVLSFLQTKRILELGEEGGVPNSLRKNCLRLALAINM